MNRESWYKASFLLNALLAGAVILLALHQRAPQEPNPARDAVEIQPLHSAPAEATRTDRSSHADLAAKPASAPEWTQWINQLRAAGVPNRVLARMVLADLEDRWLKRMDECQEKFDRGELDADAVLALAQERDNEQDAELRSALGEEGFKQWDREHLLGDLNLSRVQLSDTETNALCDLQKNLQQSLRDLERARLKGEIDEADYADALDRAQNDFDQKMKTLLGDERYAKTQGVDEGHID
jgi:hypothetical protein